MPYVKILESEYMKKTFYCIGLALMFSAPIKAQLFVGHRGSLYGVENTKESFENGCKLGYDYLETDLRVTKDGEFVCSHDENTERLGGTLVIADATLEELKAEPLKQTRGGVYYEGNLCTIKEYLDICKTGGVKPLIELKWSTGINNNDFTNIPKLIDFIDANGVYEDCIILTSMKNCLEYIRENYPDITCQFLTGQYWPNHFDWCVDHGLGPDIQIGYFDEDTVKKFHDKGLKVNMWTVNDPIKFKDFKKMGFDFVTTDKLDANELRKQ